MLRRRPVKLGFEMLRDDFSSAPMHAYKLRECYRAKTTIMVRQAEDLESEVVAKAGNHAVMLVIQYGVGDTGRRLKIHTGGVTGWISCMTISGCLLLDTKPANESVEGEFQDEPADVPIQLKPEEIEKQRKEEAKERRKHMLSIVQERAQEVEDNSEPSSDSDEEKKPSALKKFLVGMKREVFGELRSPEVGMFEEDTEEEDAEEQARIIELERKKAEQAKHRARCLALQKEKAYFELGLDVEPSPWDTWDEWFLRKIGWIKLRVIIKMKRYQVDEDGPPFQDAYDICQDLRFEGFIGAAVVANCACMAAETFYNAEDKPAYLQMAEHAFTLLFVFEFFLRIAAYSWVWLVDKLNAFDTFLVWGVGVIIMWLLRPLGLPVATVRRLSALRILRLSRLCRSIRMIPMFRDLWMLVQGVMGCTGMLFWTMVIGGVFIYTFAVAMLEFVAKSPTFEDDEDVQEWFGTLPRAMFTLMQFMVFDSWAFRAKHILRKDPKILIIFGLFIGLAGLVLFNLMTAVVIQQAFDNTQQDTEAVNRARYLRQQDIKASLRRMFADLDEDQSGYLTHEEFLACLDDLPFLRMIKKLDIAMEDLPDIFEILDNGDGEVDSTEFIDGMEILQGAAMSSEMVRAQCLVKTQNIHYVALEDAFVQNAMETFRSVELQVEQLHTDMNDIMLLAGKLAEKLDKVGLRIVVAATVGNLPFMKDPTESQVKLMERAERRRLKKGIKAKYDNSKPLDRDHAPPGAFMESTVPAKWILENGLSPLQKDPGRLKLHTDQKFKEKMAKQRAEDLGLTYEKQLNPTFSEFNESWTGLKLDLTAEGEIVTQQKNHGDLPPGNHYMASSLHSWFISPSATHIQWKKEDDENKDDKDESKSSKRKKKKK